MNDTPTNGETVIQPATPTTPPSTPTPVKTEDSAVETLKQQLEEERRVREQATMRANQLENEKKQREEAETARKAKELEEQNEFKTLYEQQLARTEALEEERAAEVQKVELQNATDLAMSEYDEGVKEMAQEIGISLTSADESSVKEFKDKLDKIKAKIGAQKVTPNNPGVTPEKPLALTNEQGIIESELSDSKFDEYARNHPGIASLMTPKQ